MNAGPEIKNIVLVHGGFVDGSGWQGVYEHLTADGYRVSVVQNPTLSLAGDVAATHLILDRIDGPAVLVGHVRGRPPAAASLLHLPTSLAGHNRAPASSSDWTDARPSLARQTTG